MRPHIAASTNPTLRLDNSDTTGTALKLYGCGVNGTIPSKLLVNSITSGYPVLVMHSWSATLGDHWLVNKTVKLETGAPVDTGNASNQVLLSDTQQLLAAKFLTDFATIDTIPDGKLALRSGTGFVGADMPEGTGGKSAYEVAVDNGFIGTEAEWLESIKGQDGTDGTNGTNGTNGKDGKDGNIICVTTTGKSSAYIINIPDAPSRRLRVILFALDSM